MENWNKFLKIEEEKKLFELTDSKGNYLWDIVRYEFASRVLQYTSTSAHEQHRGKNHGPIINAIKNRVKWVFSDLSSLFKRRNTLFFLCSRNNIEGAVIDKGAYNILSCYDIKDCILLESYGLDEKKYNIDFYRSDFSFFYHFVSVPKTQLQNLIDLFHKEYPTVDFPYTAIDRSYKKFIVDRFVYKFLYSLWGVKRVFMTQNCIQKGLIAAAHCLNIPIYEMQHGIVHEEHPAYSYPTGSSNVYMPDKIFSFSPYWFSQFYTPYSKIVPIGCDYFYVEKGENNDSKNLLVTSCDIAGIAMSDFVVKCMEDEFWHQYHIYFKLHPNEFYMRDFYENKLNDFKNVEVVCNESDIPTLARKSDAVLTYKSTIVFETLQLGAKTCIYKPFSLEIETMIPENFANLFYLDTPDELKKVTAKKINEFDYPIFFNKFNKERFFAEVQ